MTLFLAILLIAAMIATVAALVRGIVIFLQTTEADLKGTGPSAAGVRSNKMMQFRIFFQ
ncbi:HIG1 domain-containing protein, partial [Acinetobacter baumannii]